MYFGFIIPVFSSIKYCISLIIISSYYLLTFCFKSLNNNKTSDTSETNSCEYSQFSESNLVYYDDKYLNERNVKGETILHQACNNKKEDLANILIYKGADVNITNLDMNTALHLAYINNLSCEVKNNLIDHGASMLFENNEGKRPYHYSDIVKDSKVNFETANRFVKFQAKNKAISLILSSLSQRQQSKVNPEFQYLNISEIIKTTDSVLPSNQTRDPQFLCDQIIEKIIESNPLELVKDNNLIDQLLNKDIQTKHQQQLIQSMLLNNSLERN